MIVSDLNIKEYYSKYIILFMYKPHAFNGFFRPLPPSFDYFNFRKYSYRLNDILSVSKLIRYRKHDTMVLLLLLEQSKRERK